MADPRYLILPVGIVSSAWPSVRDTCEQVGIRFDPWQVALNRAMLAKDSEGFYAADTVVLSMCRQSGKTYDVGGVTFADSIIHPGSTTVWTAHRFKVARETFNELRALATTPQMSPHVDPDAITTAAGNETIPFRNGSRIVFAARERGALRGFSKVRRLVLDEAQILTEAAMADLAPTTNHAVNPQVVLMGTPPKPQDPGVVFSAIRAEAIEGKSEGVLYLEYSAAHDCDLDDWGAVAEANPSFPLRTPKRAVQRLRKLLTTDEDYAREALGIWGAANRTARVIDAGLWAELADPHPTKVGAAALAVDVTPDRAFASVGFVGARPDGRQHGELLRNDRGTGWVVDFVAAQLLHRPRSPVVLDASGPAGSLIADLKAAKIEPVVVSAREMAQACGSFYDAVTDRQFTHFDQAPLNVAVGAARKRKLGEAWAWHRSDPTVDISPLVAVTLAKLGLDQLPSRQPERSGRVW
ncbi:MAG: terminase [Actinomycetota bacterium]|nr:terminase [Actinomycetota bacterium]